MTASYLVITHLPDADVAQLIAIELVEKRLAACVNVLAPCQSFYRWEGTIQQDGEVPMLIKTTAKLYPAVEAYLHTRHPYDLPDIIAVNIAKGLPDYLRWLADATAPEAANPA